MNQNQIRNFHIKGDWSIYKHQQNTFFESSTITIEKEQCAFLVKNKRILYFFEEGEYRLSKNVYHDLEFQQTFHSDQEIASNIDIYYINKLMSLNFNWKSDKITNIKNPIFSHVQYIQLMGRIHFEIVDFVRFLRSFAFGMQPDEIVSTKQICSKLYNILNLKVQQMGAVDLENQKNTITLPTFSKVLLKNIKHYFYFAGIHIQLFRIDDLICDQPGLPIIYTETPEETTIETSLKQPERDVPVRFSKATEPIQNNSQALLETQLKDSGKIQIRENISAEDFVNILEHIGKPKFYMTLGISVLLSVLMTAAMTFFAGNSVLFLWIGAVIGLIGAQTFRYLTQKTRLRKLYFSLPQFQKENVFEIDTQGIFDLRNEPGVRLNWRDISKIVETDESFVVFQKDLSYFILLKRYFKSELLQTQCKRIFKRNLPKILYKEMSKNRSDDFETFAQQSQNGLNEPPKRIA